MRRAEQLNRKADVRAPLPLASGQPERVDYEAQTQAPLPSDTTLKEHWNVSTTPVTSLHLSTQKVPVWREFKSSTTKPSITTPGPGMSSFLRVLHRKNRMASHYETIDPRGNSQGLHHRLHPETPAPPRRLRPRLSVSPRSACSQCVPCAYRRCGWRCRG